VEEAFSPTEFEVYTLYSQMMAGWNKRDAEALAAPFAEDGEIIGFDGSQHIGRADIAATIGQTFAQHLTPPYICKVRSVLLVSPDVAMLRAIAGMVPPGKADLDPQLNTYQTLISAKRDGNWRILLFQNTPA